MATYKPYKKTESGKEEVKVPSSAISGLATVATSGSYNDLSDKPTIPDTSKFVTTDGEQEITGNKTISAARTIFDTDLVIRHDSNENKNITISSVYNGSTLLQIEDDKFFIDPQGEGTYEFNFGGVNPGTAGQVLTSNGAGKTPTWQDIPQPDISGKANLVGGNTFSGGQTFNLASGEVFKVHGLQVAKGVGTTDVFISPEDTDGNVYIWKPNSDTIVRFGDDGIDIDDDENGDIPIMLQHDTGTSGQVLTSQGAGNTPKWTTPAIKSATLTGTTLYLTLG